MSKTNSKLILAKEDFEIIMSYIKRRVSPVTFNRQDIQELEMEVKKAELVDKAHLPGDVIRLNSIVTIKEEERNKLMELTLVIPEKANIKQRLVSIMSPIGTALIGFRKGQRVKWQVPAGKKTFTIMDVKNQYA